MCSFYQHRKKTNDRFCPSIILRLKRNVVFLKCFILCCHFDWSYRRCSSSSSCKVFFFLLLPNLFHSRRWIFPQLTSGTYRILNGPQSARSFPPAAQQGPFETEITFSEQFASVWEDVRCFCFFSSWSLLDSQKVSVGTRFQWEWWIFHSKRENGCQGLCHSHNGWFELDSVSSVCPDLSLSLFLCRVNKS